MSGKRVFVLAGDGVTPLGAGVLEGYVTTYGWFTQDGQLQSLTQATEPPAAALAEQLTAAGCTPVALDANPRIRLTDGRIGYGCQIWWSPWPVGAAA